MKGAILAAIVACLPLQAFALSCTPHSLEAAYLNAQQEPGRFLIVHGRLVFDEKGLPAAGKDAVQNPPAKTSLPAQLTGKSLSGQGFATPFNGPVTLELACYGPWCAGAQTGRDVLAFVQMTTAGPVIATNPCGGYLFTSPSSADMRRVKACFAGQKCTPVR